jgi:hypothetical protein
MEHQNRGTWQPASDPDSGTVTASLIFGLAVVAIGVLFLLDNFGVPVGNFWRFWPVLLIAIGLAKVVDSRDTAGRSGGAVILLVGVVFMADKIGLPFLKDRNLWDLWPLAIIAVGFMLLWGALEGKGIAGPGGIAAAGARWHFGGPAIPGNCNMFSVFGGSNRRVSGDFTGANLTAVFGGGGLDLRNATMSTEEAMVMVNAVFGGFEIRVPETWMVQVQVTGIFGGHEDKTHQPDPRLVPNPKRLVIRGATIFGGLGVKN